MILDILNNINYTKNNNDNKINVNFEYNYNLLVNKNDLFLKKIITSLNKMTTDNYFNLYFDIIDIINDNELDKSLIISFVFKKIEQNPSFIDVYINFILLNEELTIKFINFVQNKFENELEDNIIVINIISFLFKKNILNKNIYDNIIEYMFEKPKENIDSIIELYKNTPSSSLKEKILKIPNLSYRYKFKLEI